MDPFDPFDLSPISNSNIKSVATPQQYGPGNPEPGGDGTEGHDTKEIMQTLKNCRKVLNLRSKRGERMEVDYNLFERGDLVYDMRVEEHGVVIGEKPDLRFLVDQVSHISTHRNELGSSKTYIVLTISNRKDEESGETSLQTRIRYSNGHNLRLIEETNDAPSDLEKFCNQQCIMECVDDCILRKYKRSR